MRVLVVTVDPSFAIAAARMHPDAQVLVSSPTQLPSRSVEPFDVAVVDAGADGPAIAERLDAEQTAERFVLVAPDADAPGDHPTLSRPFTLEELAGVIGLDAPAPSQEEPEHGFLGRLFRRMQLWTATDEEVAAEPDAEPGTGARVRAWPRMRDAREERTVGPLHEAITTGEELRDLLDGLPPVASVAQEAVGLAVLARERLEGMTAVVWLRRDDEVLEPFHRGELELSAVGGDHAVLSALAEDVSAVLLSPPGPAADLVGADVPAVAVAGLRYAGRPLGAVVVGGRGLTPEHRDELLAIAQERAPRVALARTLERLRQ